MFGLSFMEIGIIMVVALLVLGPKRLPALAKTMGKGLRELRKASTDLRSAIEEPLQEVRRPLEQMRDDLVDTVYRIEDEIESEAGSKALEQAEEEDHPGRLAEGDPHIPEDEEPVEVDDNRRQVEAIYAAATPAGDGEDSEAEISDGDEGKLDEGDGEGGIDDSDDKPLAKS